MTNSLWVLQKIWQAPLDIFPKSKSSLVEANLIKSFKKAPKIMACHKGPPSLLVCFLNMKLINIVLNTIWRKKLINRRRKQFQLGPPLPHSCMFVLLPGGVNELEYVQSLGPVFKRQLNQSHDLAKEMWKVLNNLMIL